MEFAEFEEKQYESALGNELAAGLPTVYPSGQVLEAVLGYDLALRPGDPRIWQLLNWGFPPGVLLSSGLWATAPRQPRDANLPQDLVSLILQVKRPHRLDHWRAGQHHYWLGPYFRFHLTLKQQDQLAGLEAGVTSLGLVRYAAPAFLLLRSLYQHQRNREVASHSTFVSPRSLIGHRLWSYAGPGTSGYANPEGNVAASDTWATLVAAAREHAASQTLYEHVLALAEVAGEQAGDEAWFDALIPRDVDDDPSRRAAVSAAVRFMDHVSRLGAEWYVIDTASESR